jgi:hypothetical protein
MEAQTAVRTDGGRVPSIATRAAYEQRIAALEAQLAAREGSPWRAVGAGLQRTLQALAELLGCPAGDVVGSVQRLVAERDELARDNRAMAMLIARAREACEQRRVPA